MPKNDIGGFFVSLGLNIDKNSFETGNRLIDNVGNSFNKLIGSARNAAVVLAGTAIATGAVESQAGKLAEEIGISTEALELWKATAKVAGSDITQSLSKVANVLQRIRIDGSGLEEFTKSLGELGIVSDEKIDIEKLLSLSPDELIKEVLDISHRALANGAQKTQVQQIVKDIIGEEGEKLFIDLERRGTTIGKELERTAGRTYTTNETNENAQNFITEVKLLKQASENMTKLLGSEVAKQLTDYVKDINVWIDEHGDEIASGIKTVSEGVGKLVGKFVDFITDEDVQNTVETIGEAFVDSTAAALETTSNMITSAAQGDWAGVGEAWKEGAQKTLIEPTDKVAGLVVNNNETLSDYQNQTGQSNTETVVNAGVRSIPGLKWIAHGTDWLMNKTGLMSDEEYEANSAIVKGKNKKVKDGIMRPDGTVTQVEPDDWVIAARNLGDVARAFQPEEEKLVPTAENEIQMPHITQSVNNDLALSPAINELSRYVGMLAMTFRPQQQAAVAGGEYTINQTFNINGSNDMPQVIRQQAYNGAHNGMLDLMSESSRRLQLMSGTR